MGTMANRANEAGGGRSRPARVCLLTLALAGVVGLGWVAAACGGSGAQGAGRAGSSETAASGSASPGASRSGDPAAYSACMRKNGVKNFPDPDSQGRIKVTTKVDASGRKSGVDSSSPPFRKAQEACRKLLPNGGRPDPQAQAKERQQQLQFAACMRRNGVPKYPDPVFTANGGSTTSIGAGVDPGSPTFQAAQQKCGKLFGGGSLATGSSAGGAP